MKTSFLKPIVIIITLVVILFGVVPQFVDAPKGGISRTSSSIELATVFRGVF